MKTLTGRNRAKLWPAVAVLAAAAGVMWFGWWTRSPWGEPTSVLAPLPSGHTRGSEPAIQRRDEAAPRSSRTLTEEEKIERLLKFIEQSGVVFIRNGSEYDGTQAAAHLRDKLRASGSSHPTLDDFIEKIASRSSITGHAYRVRLTDDRTVDAGPWLRLQCDKTSGELTQTSSKESE